MLEISKCVACSGKKWVIKYTEVVNPPKDLKTIKAIRCPKCNRYSK